MSTSPLLPIPIESAALHILIMDECAEILHLLRDVLSEDGARLTMRRELLSLAEIKRLRPSLIIMERRFDGAVAASWLLIRELRQDPVLAGTPIVLCTTDATSRISVSLQDELQMLHVHVLIKPFHLDDLRSLVRGARVRDRVARRQARPGHVQTLPGTASRSEAIHQEEIHHEPALPDHRTPLPGWTPRRS